MIEIPSTDGPMPAFSATPEGAPLGAVIVIQEAFGLTEHIGAVTEQLASAGFRAIAPALFHRAGAPVIAYDDLEAIRPVMATLTAEGIASDLDAAVSFLGAEGYEQGSIGVVGFCMGGSVALFAATSTAIGAAVTYYGGGLTTGRFGFPPLVELSSEMCSAVFVPFKGPP